MCLVWENPEQKLKLEYLPAAEVDSVMMRALDKWAKGEKALAANTTAS